MAGKAYRVVLLKKVELEVRKHFYNMFRSGMALKWNVPIFGVLCVTFLQSVHHVLQFLHAILIQGHVFLYT